MITGFRAGMAMGLAAIGASTAATAAPYPGVAGEIRAINAEYVCPESLASDQARVDAMEAIGHRLAANRLSYAQAQKVLQTLYALHGCGVAATTNVAMAAAPQTGAAQ